MDNDSLSRQSENIKEPRALFRKKAGEFILFTIIFCAGAAAGFSLNRYSESYRYQDAVFGWRKIYAGRDTYRLANPLIAFDSTESQDREYKELKETLKEVIARKKEEKIAENISVYFRDLENGRWLGIEEDEKFDPASLLKVPVLLAYLKYAETHPEILSQTHLYTDRDIADMKSIADIDTTTVLQKNTPYTTEKLLEEMIIRSDNIAEYMLLLNGPENALRNTFSDLGIQTNTGDYTISARTYSLFFRTLYNATYLNAPMSEKALELLERTDYRDGLRAGLPPFTVTAQKFGSYIKVLGGKFIYGEMHDCGIIYHPSAHPYILCVMTKGRSDSSALESILKDISQLTYDYISEHSEIND